MSETINLAGKNIIIDSIKETGKSSLSLEGVRSALETAKLKAKTKNLLNQIDKTIDDVHDDLVDAIGEVAGDLRDLTTEVNTKLDDEIGTVTLGLNELVDQVAGTEASGLKNLITTTEEGLKKYTDDTAETINGTISDKESSLKSYADDKRDEAKGYADDLKTALDGDIADVAGDVSSLSGTVSTNDQNISKALCRIGARFVTRSGVRQVDIYAYNPRKNYEYFDVTDPDAYRDEYYTSAGYVNCEGANLPVSIPANYATFTPANHGGVWALAIYKASAQDEAYTPIILCPFANGQNLEWRKADNTAMSSMLDVWIFGSFKVEYSSGSVTGLSELNVSQIGIVPGAFVKNRFMQIIGEADGLPTADFTDWAIAMGVDQIYTRLAALEFFVGHLHAKYVDVGNGTDSPSGGFFMHIHDANGLNPPEIIAKYNGNVLWQIDPTTGKMYGNFAKVRQYMPFQFDDSLDSSYPMECDFYIPANAVIVSIKLSSKGKNYRAYSKGAASGGGTKTSGVVSSIEQFTRDSLVLSVTKNTSLNLQTESAGDHKHTYSKITSIGGVSGNGAHTHSLYKSSLSTDYTEYSNPDYHRHAVSLPSQTGNSFGQADGAHSHALDYSSYTDTNTSETGAHTHKFAADSVVTDVSINTNYQNKLTNAQIDHIHEVNISHSHDLTFGIYESTTPAGVELKCSNDGGSTYGSAISGMGSGGDVSGLDITSNFSGTGWKAIKFTSTRLGRIQAQLILELLVTT